MHVNSLSLLNYRNYEKEKISFNKGVNIFYGDNAQGKTNILEAIYLFTTAKSHRTNKNNQIIRFDQDYAAVKINFKNYKGDNSGEIILSQDQKKRIKLNGIPINKTGKLMGFFNAVMFSPEDLNIVKEGPAVRRYFLDVFISQLKPDYFYNLQQFYKIISQRNSLLKEINYNKSLKDTLFVWDNKLIEYGAKIILKRNEFTEKLSVIAKKIHSEITDDNESLKTYYRPNVLNSDIIEEDNIKEIFRKKLEENREKEIEKGITMIGPHRDDMDIEINGMKLKSYGSQGQQRTAVLSLKIAEMEFIKEYKGEYPVLLLDDVMSELDKKRQKYFMKNINDRQIFITCTDIKEFEGYKNISVYKVEKGKVLRRTN